MRAVKDAHFREYFPAALRRTLVLVCVQIILGTFAFGSDTGSDRIIRTAVVQMSYISSSISYLHIPPHGFSADVLRSATFFLISTANTGFRHAYATLCYARPGPTSAHASVQLQQTGSCLHHHPWRCAPAYQRHASSNRPRRSPATERLHDRIAPIPAAFQPVQGPPPHQLAYPTVQAARLGPDRRSVALHSACTPANHAIRYPTVLHVPSRNTPKNSEKKTPIHRSNNVFQAPGGGIRAQRTWHQLWPRANPAYGFLVPQPLLPASGRISSDSLPAERQVCHQPSQIALHYAGDLSLANLNTPGTITLNISVRHEPITSQLGALLRSAPPATSELGSGVQDRRTVHARDPSMVELSNSSTITPAINARHEPFTSQLGTLFRSAPPDTSELGSGVQDKRIVQARDPSLAELSNLATITLNISVRHEPITSQLGALLRSAPPATSEPGSGVQDRRTVHARDPSMVELHNSSTITPAINARHEPFTSQLGTLFRSAPPDTSELGSGVQDKRIVHARDPSLAELRYLATITLNINVRHELVTSQPGTLLHSVPPDTSEPGSGVQDRRTVQARDPSMEELHNSSTITPAINARHNAPLSDLAPVDQQSRTPNPTNSHA